ncbi:MAG: patatin-like phospholipase family protein [Rudaea sp.]|uniref:patatin-like phospholipase family protein n=1 Tax=unclassified Rudaea TaxID=2627037 RepID=UPI0010FA2581|nr:MULTISPECIES: patatin-like phospholipase family protein [unclassified Rudaea]MBN8886684.1 patatin-like phospholipase family protein [Rudaea sp.]MBR0346710.1 patatin-like phospholipase family protein [Rudaea sp.]
MFRALACLLLAVTCGIAFDAFAQPPTAHAKTCLVLGGGGARGAAHIGVLKVLEREHVPVECITGTSMGAIVGGLYAAGYNATEIEVVLKSIDWKDMFNDDPPREELPMRRKEDELRFLGGIELGLRDGKIALPRGVIQGQKLQLLLRRLLLSTLQTQNFDDLPIPFRSVATDIGNGEKVVFAKGDLPMAIRASMSVPAAFAPIRYQGHLLVDGGIVDNVPIEEARKLGGTRLIVVDVGAPLLKEENLTSPIQIANQMLTAMMKRQTDAQLHTLGAADVLLVPQLGDLSSTAFDRAAEAVVFGEQAADANLVALRRFSASESDYAQFAANHKQRPFDPPLVAFLDVLTGRSRTADYVQQRLSDVVGKPFDPAKLEDRIGLAYGEGSYERITYDIVQKDGQTGLSVQPVDKSWGPNFLRLGLRLSDNFAGRNSYQLFTEANFTGLNSLGGESRNRVQLGQITELYSEFLQPWGTTGEFYIAPQLQYKAYNFPIPGQKDSELAEYRRSRRLAALEFGYTPDSSWQFSSSLEYGRDLARLHIGQPASASAASGLPPSIATNFGGVVLRAVYDDLDSSGFPTRGMRVDASEEVLLTQLGSTDAARITRLRWDQALSYGPNHWLLGASINTATGAGANLQIAAQSQLGGLANFSGFADNQLFASQTALLRAVYYRRMTNTDSLFSLPLYLGGSLEAGGYWNSRNQIGKNMLGAGSVFVGIDTFLGPIFLGYGYAQGGHNAAYLTFGSLLRTNE